jgi:hypothetical protein
VSKFCNVCLASGLVLAISAISFGVSFCLLPSLILALLMLSLVTSSRPFDANVSSLSSLLLVASKLLLCSLVKPATSPLD